MAWRTIAIAFAAALLASWGYLFAAGTLRDLTRPWVAPVLAWASSTDEAKPTETYRSEDDIGKRQETYGLSLGYESGAATAAGQRGTNLQEVFQVSRESSVWRLSRSVGRLLVFSKDKDGGEVVSYCTATLISDAYILTAAHCFFRDPNLSGWSKPLAVQKVQFQMGFLRAGGEAEAVRLDLETQPAELACGAKPCTFVGQPEDGYDFAVLKLKSREIEKARAARFYPARLGDVAIYADHPFLIFQHARGNQLAFVERFCVGLRDVDAIRSRRFFPHLCDTAGGSSGAPVFSRDHEAVVGVHVQGQRAFSADDRAAQVNANHAVHIHAVAAISKIIGAAVPVEVDPPTAEQNILINAANEQGERARQLLADGRGTLAAYVALAPQERVMARPDRDFLLARMNKAQGALAEALAERRELVTFTDHNDEIWRVSFSRDGTQILSCSFNDKLIIRDANTGKTISELDSFEEGGLLDASFAPDGKHVVTSGGYDTAGEYNVIKLWSIKTGKFQLKLKINTDGNRLKKAVFSNDGKRIAGIADYSSFAAVWDAETGSRLIVLKSNTEDFTDIAYSPSGDSIATSSRRNGVQIWDARTGLPLLNLGSRDSNVASVAFSFNGARLVSTEGNVAKVWDAQRGTLINEFSSENFASSASFSPDGNRIVVGYGDTKFGLGEHVVRIWDTKTRVELDSLRGHTAPINSVSFSPNGTQIVTGSMDKTVRIWSTKSGGALSTLYGHTGALRSVDFSPDGTRIVTGSDDGSARVWDSKTSKQLLTLAGHKSFVTSVRYSPNGKLIVTGSSDASAIAWSANTGIDLWTYAGHKETIASVAISKNGNYLVTGSRDFTAKVWSMDLSGFSPSRGMLIRTFEGHKRPVFGVAISPDEKRVLTGSVDRSAQAWDLASGTTRLKLLGHEDTVFDVGFSPDGNRIVTASADKTANIWDAKSGMLQTSLIGHEGQVISAAFSPTDNYLITTSADRTARLWDVSSGLPITIFSGHKGPVTSAAFSADGKRIVTASTDMTARIWKFWKLGNSLIGEAHCRLRSVKPSEEECRIYAVECSRPRPLPAACKSEMALSKE